MYFATDWEEYGQLALEELTQTESLHNRYEAFAQKESWRPRTKFEQKGIDAGRSIYELYFLKDEQE